MSHLRATDTGKPLYTRKNDDVQLEKSGAANWIGRFNRDTLGIRATGLQIRLQVKVGKLLLFFPKEIFLIAPTVGCNDGLGTLRPFLHKTHN